MSIKSVMPSNHLILCSLFSSCSQSFLASGSFPHQVAKVLELQLQGWLVDLLAVQGTLESLLQQHDLNASINSSVFSLLYGPTLTSRQDYWRNHSFDKTDLCQQSDGLLLNTLSRFVIAFFPRSKHLLISWLQSPSAVILSPGKQSLSLFPLFLQLFANIKM